MNTNITRLTRLANQKFADMVEATSELQSCVHSTLTKIKEAEAQLTIVASRESKDAKEAVSALTDEINRLDQRRAELQSKYVQQMRLIAAVRTWLVGLPPNVELRDAEFKRFTKPVDGETTDGAIWALREEIVKLQSARQSVMSAVPPIEDLYAAASARVKELVDRGRPVVTVDRGVLSVRFPTDSAFSGGLAKDAVAFAAWLHPEVVEARLRQQIDAKRANDIRQHVPIMTTEERDRKVEELDRKILEMERDEEHLIIIGEEFNMFVPRRESANPLAILCLTMEKKQRAVA